MSISPERSYAVSLDRQDPLHDYRSRFYIPDNTIYLDGNSLGPLSKDAEESLNTIVEQWRDLGIVGWLQADPPWFYLGEELGRRMAPLVGADTSEVVVTGGTTINLHALAATFYQPSGERRKILINELDFPSDVYALRAQIELKGGDPADDLVVVQSRDGRLIEEDDIIAAMSPEIALIVLPSVFYRSGQLLDIERVTRAAHEHGIIIGWDCCHSAGSIPHKFDEWEVDFAFWCTYKYLNAGPGAIGALYVNQRHFDRAPALPGWWGYDKSQQFDMRHDWHGAHGAGAWQISTISVLSAAPLLGSLAMIQEIGIDQIRQASLQRTDYLIELLETRGLFGPDYGYAVGTPRQHGRRGGHVAVEHANAPQINAALKARGVVPDFRPPNVVRLAPIPLYVSFEEIWQSVDHLRDIIDTGEYRQQQATRDVVA